MAFAEKGDLFSRIKSAQKGSPIPTFQVLEWITQATLALKYLHDLRILHRDLKSQNMFLTADERLKIGDFGIRTDDDRHAVLHVAGGLLREAILSSKRHLGS